MQPEVVMFMQWKSGLWKPDWAALPADVADYLAAMSVEYDGGMRAR